MVRESVSLIVGLTGVMVVCLLAGPLGAPWWYESRAGTHFSMLPQLNHWMVGGGTPSAMQETRCLFPGRGWSVRSLIWEGTERSGWSYFVCNKYLSRCKRTAVVNLFRELITVWLAV